jgi:hypothetical protein
VAFLRSVEIHRAAPHIQHLAEHLHDQNAEAKLFFTDGDCARGDFPGDWERMPEGATPQEAVEAIRRWRPDAFVSISLRDENAVRDAVVAAELATSGVSTVMHAPGITCVLANKAETKSVLRRDGFDVPGDVLVDGDVLNGRTVHIAGYREHITRAATELGFPLLCKPLWDSFGNGIRYLDGPAALQRLLSQPPDGHVLLERCLTGELCSVEIVGRDGIYHRQPLVWKGPTGSEPSFLFGQLRWAGPRPAAEKHFAPVAEQLLGLCTELDLNGAVEVEMIYKDGHYDIIEINPRVSGTTLLSIVASGRNTYAALLAMALHRWPDRPPPSGARWALEFPIAEPTAALLSDAKSGIDVVRAGTLRIGGQEYGGNMVASCAFGGEDAFLATLVALDARHHFLEAHVLDEISTVLAGGPDGSRPAS